MTRRLSLVLAFLLFFLQLSLGLVNATLNTDTNTPQFDSTTSSRRMSLSISKQNTPSLAKAYDLYIIITPYENSIGRAVAEEMSRKLSAANGDTHQEPTNVICMVRCPSGVKHSTKSTGNTYENSELSFHLKLMRQVTEFYKALFGKVARIFFRNIECQNQQWLHRFSNESPVMVLPSKAELNLDPFGNPSRIRKSCQNCLTAIQRELLQSMVSESTHGSLSAKINLRGILFNPYGCPPTENNLPNHSLSPLGAYKLLSIAIFTDLAFANRAITIEVPRDEVETIQDCSSSIIDNAGGDTQSPPLRIITVGTEAARGLPKMGIPVPNLTNASEALLWKKLLLYDESPHSESVDWEEKYAEMNALVVLYFKALQTQVQHTTKNLYLGIVSPGMTPESFNIVHVPKAARTLAFRLKLWLCRRKWVFDWLQKSEIAKSTTHAGKILATALLNAPIDANPKSNDANEQKSNEAIVRWDDVYSSGSFVGAQSGTGGPLCEQSLLLYNATNNKVSLPSSNENKSHTTERFNFLANQKLQDLLYQTVRKIIIAE